MMQAKQISDNEIYLLIKYIKRVLWRVVKCLPYIEDARCLKVKSMHATFLAHIIVLGLIAPKISGEQYKSCSSSLWNFLRPHVTYSCRHGNEPSGSKTLLEFLDYVRNCQLLKRDSAPWSYSWLIGWLVGWLAGRLVSQLVGSTAPSLFGSSIPLTTIRVFTHPSGHAV